MGSNLRNYISSNTSLIYGIAGAATAYNVDELSLDLLVDRISPFLWVVELVEQLT